MPSAAWIQSCTEDSGREIIQLPNSNYSEGTKFIHTNQMASQF